jgi:hypothetical protein
MASSIRILKYNAISLSQLQESPPPSAEAVAIVRTLAMRNALRRLVATRCALEFAVVACDGGGDGMREEGIIANTKKKKVIGRTFGERCPSTWEWKIVNSGSATAEEEELVGPTALF